MNVTRLTPLHSALLVIDVQDNLLAKMPDAHGLVHDVCFLMDAARLLQIPVFCTEQYPKGLGSTHPEIVRRVPGERAAKTTFSCCGDTGVLAELRTTGRRKFVLAGMETHVCVLQTALDLLAEGSTVFLPVDSLQSRFRIDHETALRRLEGAGSILTTVESTVFEWLGGSDHPQFKNVIRMIQERMARLG